METLSVGMYCYNKTNRKLGIGKIIDFQRNNNVNIRYKNDIELVSIGNVIASFNIIDILECGDYVNGYKVLGKSNYVRKLLELDKWLNNCYKNISDEDIKSIVTKEQFSSMEYRLGDDK